MSTDVTTETEPIISQDSPPQEPVRQRRKWPPVLLTGLLIAIAALIWVAPQIAGRYLVQQGLNVEGPTEQTVHIKIGETSLGWLSPVTLSDVTVHDLEGQPLVQVATVVSDRPLWQLATNRTQPGRFIARQPEVRVLVREDGSNAADVINVITSTTDSDGYSQLALTVEQGQVTATDAEGNELAHIENLSLSVTDARRSERELNFELTADVQQQDKRLPVEAGFEWAGGPTADPLRSGKGSFAVTFPPLSMTSLATHLQKWVPELDLRSGDVAGKMLAEWDFSESQRVNAQGTLTATNVKGTITSGDESSREIDWPSEELTFAIEGDYSPESDSLLLSKAAVQSTPVTLNATGGITDLRGECIVDLRGELRYDLDRFVNTLAADYRDQVQVRGLQTREFKVLGPLVRQIDGVATYDLSQVALEADLGWEEAHVFGVHSEQATIVTRLIDGVLEIEPRHVPVSGGQFLGKPHVDLQVQPAHAEMAQGLVLENIELSPEMCHLWLKYLSPPLAEATRAQGRFSIALSDTNLPLKDMASSEFQGVLTVHSAEVKPGPFVEEIVELVSGIEGMVSGRRNVSTVAGDVWISMPEQEIAFHMTGGRIHHASIEFHAGPVTIRSTGSVGIDESLDLMISVTLPDEWLRGPILSDLFSGEVIRIPVVGTFDRPQFDRRGLKDFGKRIAARATGGLLRRLLAE
ncbi:MAG: hypothetical protein KDA93_12030 [Planctomycetaceae bacterium]|nr:hypothetical protein [Planctomycetaceae bacterium]